MRVFYFNKGAGYVLSWDLVTYLANDKWCEQNKEFQEDALIASCIAPLGYGLTAHSNVNDIYDDPQAGTEWAHAYTPSTLFIHQLKRNDRFLAASLHFLRNDMSINEENILGLVASDSEH